MKVKQLTADSSSDRPGTQLTGAENWNFAAALRQEPH